MRFTRCQLSSVAQEQPYDRHGRQADDHDATIASAAARSAAACPVMERAFRMAECSCSCSKPATRITFALASSSSIPARVQSARLSSSTSLSISRAIAPHMAGRRSKSISSFARWAWSGTRRWKQRPSLLGPVERDRIGRRQHVTAHLCLDRAGESSLDHLGREKRKPHHARHVG